MRNYSKIFVAHWGGQIASLAEFRIISNSSLFLHSLTQEKITPIFSLNEFCYEEFKNILQKWWQKEKIKERAKLTLSLPSQFFSLDF